jgi:hypothetical protein
MSNPPAVDPDALVQAYMRNVRRQEALDVEIEQAMRESEACRLVEEELVRNGERIRKEIRELEEKMEKRRREKRAKREAREGSV